MSIIFDITRDGAACMVEPAWMRTRRALAGASMPATRLVETGWTADVSDWRDRGQ